MTVAPSPPMPTRNKLGIAALVLVLITVVLPIIAFIVVVIAATIEDAEGGGLGYAILGAFFFVPVAASLIAPLAILGILLGIVSLFLKGRRKLQGVLAIVLGIAPALTVFLLPTAILTFF
jgi:hypothetical protein